MSIFQTITANIKEVIGLPDSHFYDAAQADKLSQNIKRGTAKYPAILMRESAAYSSTINQDGINLKNEIRVNGDFSCKIYSNDIDEMIKIEETIKSHFATPQKLTVACDNECLKSAAIVFNADEKIDRENGKNGIFTSTLSMKYIDVILPKEVENPIKIELDKNTQFRVMKHLYLLDYTLSDIGKEMQNAPQETETYKKLENQYKDIKEQISSMYTFENLCAERIATSDHGFVFCYANMVNNKWDIIQATEAYKQKHEQEKKTKEAEEARINDIKERYSKTGDKELNRYTDAVIEDIKNKFKLEFPIDIYGGTTFVDFFKFNALRELKFPLILVHTDSNYTFANKSYTNISSDGSAVSHGFSTTALPIEYGIRIIIMATKQEQVKEIIKQLQNLYTEEVQIKVPDPEIEGEFCSIKLAINPDVSIVNSSFNEDAYGGKIFHARIAFKRFPAVYHPYQYNVFQDISNNQILQVRLLQRAEFLLLCDSKIRNEAIPELDSAYKNLFTLNQKKSLFGSVLGKIGSAFESQEYKQLKECFKNNIPINRNLFDTALSKITSVYPSLYDKMVQGWSVDQIREDLNKYADLFNKEWNGICNDVMTACLPMAQQLGMTGDRNQPTEQIHKGLVFYIEKMVNDVDYTLMDAKKAYDEQLRIEEEERIEREQRTQEMLDSWSESFRERRNSSGGFFGNMMSTAGGVALGNKMSGNSKRKNEKKDLMGTAGCMYGKKDEHGWTIRCDVRCPLHSYCSRYF